MQHVIGCPLGTRLQRIERAGYREWRLWIATSDYVHGTYLYLHHDGMVERVTVRENEGDESIVVCPRTREWDE